MRHRELFLAQLILLLAATGWAQKKSRDEQVRDDKKELADNEDWIYNDFSQAAAQAKASKKPMLVVFR